MADKPGVTANAAIELDELAHVEIPFGTVGAPPQKPSPSWPAVPKTQGSNPDFPPGQGR